MEMSDFTKWWDRLSGGQQRAYASLIWRAANGELVQLEGLRQGRFQLNFEEAIHLLVDRRGLCLPEDLAGKVKSPNRDFKLTQVGLEERDVKQYRSLWQEHWPFDGNFPSLDEIMTRYQRILDWLKSDANQQNGVANLLNGPHYLGMMPKVRVGDLGTFTEKLVEAAGRSYLQQFPGRQFNNYRRGELAQAVGLAEGVRYHKFLWHIARHPVVWLSFRTCLQGFSIPAAIQQERKMPERLILSGAPDAAMEMIAYPRSLARNFHTVGMDCAANTFQSEGSLYFRASDDRLDFGYGSLIASEDYSSGLLVFGKCP